MVHELIARLHVNIGALAFNNPNATFAEEEANLLHKVHLALIGENKPALNSDLLSGQISRFISSAKSPGSPGSAAVNYLDAFIMLGQMLALSRSATEYHGGCLEQLNQDLTDALSKDVSLIDRPALPFAVVCLYHCFTKFTVQFSNGLEGKVNDLAIDLFEKYGNATFLIREKGEFDKVNIDYVNLYLASSILLACIEITTKP